MRTLRQANDVDLNLLLALEALLEEHNVTRAAKRVGLSQPAMSHALSRLRQLLDDPLFVRTPKGVLPTARAQRLAAPLGAALQNVRELLSDERFDPQTARRTFVLSTPDFGQLVLLPALLALLRAEAPGVQVVARSVPGNDLELLESGEIDLLLGGHPSLPPQLKRQPLLKTGFVVIGRRDNPLLSPRLTLEQFAALPHVKLTFRPGLGGPVDAAIKAAGLKPNIQLTVGDLVVALFVVARTDLVVTGGELVLKALEGVLPLKGVPVPFEGSTLTISQIWHERQHADPGHAWLRGLVKRAAAGLSHG